MPRNLFDSKKPLVSKCEKLLRGTSMDFPRQLASATTPVAEPGTLTFPINKFRKVACLVRTESRRLFRCDEEINGK